MPNLTSVGLTAGAATSGTGTVSTIDNLIGTAGSASAQVLTVQGIASGTAQPVSLASTTVTGTVAVTESGTWTVQPGNTANTTAWKVDGSAVTQPISNTALTNINTALGSTALDLGKGTGGSRTLRVAVDSSQVTGSNYETVAASQTAQVMGSTGATGDYIAQLLIIPATTSPGNVLLLDNATSITVFTGGATSVSNLVPFSIPLGMTSVSGAWKVTTGTNVSAIGVGNFT